MISVLLAVALSSTDVAALLDSAALGSFRIAERYEALAETRGERRERRCQMATRATEAVFELKKIKLRGQVLILDETIKAKVGGPVYKLRPEDGPVVDYAILDAEQKAEKYKLLCQS